MTDSLGRPTPWPAPGKLNLFLHVVGRRPDGYHELQTAFQFIEPCDAITFERLEPGRIERRNPIPGVAEPDDLTARAARLLHRVAKAGGRTVPGVAIRLDK